jgi:polar amino acid transport system substrate-binding protein
VRLFKLLIVVVSLLVSLQSRGRTETVSIIAEDDWYPYSGAFEGAPRGMAVDIVKAVYAAEGIDVQFVVMNYDRGMGLVSEGGAIGCFNAPRTDEIEHVYYWHAEPMFNANSFFYARSDYTGLVSSLADVAGKRVGLTQGSKNSPGPTPS